MAKTTKTKEKIDQILGVLKERYVDAGKKVQFIYDISLANEDIDMDYFKNNVKKCYGMNATEFLTKEGILDLGFSPEYETVDNPSPTKQEQGDRKSKETSTKLIPIYRNLDNVDLSKLMNDTKNIDWPKNSKYIVNVDGIEFTVKTGFRKAKNNFSPMFYIYKYDAYSAMTNMISTGEAACDYLYAKYIFDKTKLAPLSSDQYDLRNKFIVIIANLINNQETIEEIVKFAPKKKDGTLHRGKLTKIACTGLARDYNNILALLGRAETSTSMSIVLEGKDVTDGDIKLWESDFISTYHNGLKISDLLKDSVE